MPGQILDFTLDDFADTDARAQAQRDYELQMREVRDAERIDEDLVEQIRFF